jgi:glycosyltransferase involved in cell wall biosynthesis
MGQRARDFASRLAARYDIRIAHRAPQKLRAIFHFFAFLVKTRPAVSYVFDMSYSGVLGAALYKLLFRNRLVIETGDAIYDLARAGGLRGPMGLWLTRLLENFSLCIADRVVVRGSFHQRWLAEQGIESDVIQDGVDTSRFKPQDVSALRRRLGLDGVLTIGVVGSSVWNERLQWCYGLELVEVIRLLKDREVVGVMIGGGSGIERLKARCREYGIEDRMRFWGYVPYDELAEKLNLMDVCLSTQTNNLVGQVRTTGKLPLYLATGRYVLASDVGEAALVLPPEMRVPYVGGMDESYPQRLAEKIVALLEQPAALHREVKMMAIAEQHFEYVALANKLAGVIEMMISPSNHAALANQVNEELVRR